MAFMVNPPRLITNVKTVKLWRVDEHEMHQVVPFLSPVASAQGDSRTVPRDGADAFLGPANYASKDTSCFVLTNITRLWHFVSAMPHAYHIKSIAVSSDEEIFLSAVDLRINAWSLAKGSSGASGFNVVNNKPDLLEALIEVITCAEFHQRIVTSSAMRIAAVLSSCTFLQQCDAV